MIIGAIFFFFFNIVAVWLLLQHYHEHVLMPELNAIRNDCERIEKHQVDRGELGYFLEEYFRTYHEDKLLPAMTLLASQRISTEPPVQELPEEVVTRRKKFLDEHQMVPADIENIWDKVKASY